MESTKDYSNAGSDDRESIRSTTKLKVVSPPEHDYGSLLGDDVETG